MKVFICFCFVLFTNSFCLASAPLSDSNITAHEILEFKCTQEKKPVPITETSGEGKKIRCKKYRYSNPPATPSIVSIISPVVSVGVPPYATSFTNVSSTRHDVKDKILSPFKEDVQPLRTKPVDPTEIKFKIKDIEAGVKTSCMPLVICFFVFFVALAAFSAWKIQKVGGKKLTLALFFGILIAGAILSVTAYQIFPKKMAQSLTPKIEVEAVPVISNGFTPIVRRDDSAYVSEQLAQVARDVKFLSNKYDSNSAKDPLPKDGKCDLRLLFAILGSIPVLFFIVWFFKASCSEGNKDKMPPFKVRALFTGSPGEIASEIPFDKIYELEDLLLPFHISTNSRHSTTWVKPDVDINRLLNTINSVRRELEGGGSDKIRAGEIETQKYELLDDSWRYGDVNKSLCRLDTVLSSRHGAKLRVWKVEVLKALADTRSTILSACRVVAAR